MKAKLYKRCLELVTEKVKALQEELAAAYESAMSESKSTAGDKHETGRAMIHLEQEKLHSQLVEAQRLVEELEQIRPEETAAMVQLGALVQTDRATFYLAVGLGKVHFDGKDIFVVSPESPIAAQMVGKRVGESFVMNGTEYVIWTVE